MLSSNPTRLGQFVVEDSLLHRLDPRTKLLCSAIVTAGLFTTNTYQSLLVLAVLAALLCAVAQLPPRQVARSLRPMLAIIVGASFLHLFASPGPYLFELGPLKLSQPGLVEAGLVDLRLSTVLVIGVLLSSTTSPMALAQGLELLLSPLARFGLPIYELATMVSIAFRFVPTFFSELEKLTKAQAARGVDFSTGSFVHRAQELAPLGIPLIVATMQRSDELALAMEARCFPGRNRSRFHELRMTVVDRIALVSCVGIVAMLLLYVR